MKLYKVDTQAWTVRAVEGEPWPGSDSDGERCYENSHFADERDAWAKLQAEVSAWVQLAAREVSQRREWLANAERDSADALVAFERVRAQLSQSPDRTGGTLHSPLIGD